jgi:hypothetical protein
MNVFINKNLVYWVYDTEWLGLTCVGEADFVIQLHIYVLTLYLCI